MFNKVTVIAALVAASFTAQAQTSVNAKFETIQINKKCPDCGQVSAQRVHKKTVRK